MEAQKILKTQLFEQHASSIYRYAYFRLQNKEAAEDITSDVFRKLLEHPEISETTAKTWMISVARNLMIDKFRVKREQHHEDIADYQEVHFEENNYEQELLTDELIAEIKTNLESLPTEQREVINLKVWEELTFAQIAKITDTKEETAKYRFYAGLEKLKDSIQNYEEKQQSLGLMIAAVALLAGTSTYLPSKAFLTSLSINLGFMATGTAAAGATAASTSAAGAAASGAAATGVAGMSTPVIGGIIATSVIAVGGVAAVATGAISLPGTPTASTSSMTSTTSSAPVSYTSSTTTETSTTTSETVAMRERPTLPAGWTWTKFDKCDVEIPTPPATLNRRESNDSLRYWGWRVETDTNSKSVEHLSRWTESSEPVGFEGNDPIGIEVECLSGTGLNQTQYINKVKQDHLAISTQFYTAKVNDQGTKYPWGFAVRKMKLTSEEEGRENVDGFYPISSWDYYFTMNGKNYKISFHGEGLASANNTRITEIKTSSIIFNNLYFKQAPACVDKKITNPITQDFSYEYNTCEWTRKTTYKEGETLQENTDPGAFTQFSAVWKDTLTNKVSGGKLVLDFAVTDPGLGVGTCAKYDANHVKTANGFRIKVGNKFEYYDKNSYQSTNSTAAEIYRRENGSNFDFCHIELQFATDSDVTGLLGLVSPSYTGGKIAMADKVVDSFEGTIRLINE